MRIFISEDPTGLVLAVISSTMFMVWQRTVGGRLESRLRFNKLLSWNTFPLPELSAQSQAGIVRSGEQVLKAHAALGNVALADMYPAEGLDPNLQAAHDALDEAVDDAFQLKPRHGATGLDRQDLLFARYAELSFGPSGWPYCRFTSPAAQKCSVTSSCFVHLVLR